MPTSQRLKTIAKSMKTEKRNRLLIALFLLLLILIAAFFGIPRILDLNRYKGWLVSKIEEAVEGDVYIGHITWGFTDGVWLKADAFSISVANAFPIDMKLSDVHAKLAILPLLSKRIEIEELTVDGSEVVFHFEPEKDRPNLAKQIMLSTVPVSANPGEVKNSKDNAQSERINSGEKNSQGTEEGPLGTLLPVEISLKRLSAKNGRVRIENGLLLPGERTLHSFREVSIEATNIIPGRKIDFLLSLRGEATTGLEYFQAKGSFKGLVKTFIIEDPEIKTTLTKGITEAIKGIVRIPGTIVKDVEDLSKEIDEYIKEEGIK
jgi:autotransporter translocation and assembly factor TamB